MATDSLREFLPFFDGDEKGPQMVNALFEGDQYTTSVMTAVLKQLLRAENYRKFQSYRATTGQSMLPDDVPPDVADFVVNAALVARAIDKPSGTGDLYRKFYDQISTEFSNFFDKDIGVLSAPKVREINSAISGTPVVNVYSGELGRYGNKIGSLYLFTMADMATADAKNRNAPRFSPNTTTSQTIEKLSDFFLTSAKTTLNRFASGVSGGRADFSNVIKNAINNTLVNVTAQMRDEIKMQFQVELQRNPNLSQIVENFMRNFDAPLYRKMMEDNIKTEIQKAVGNFLTRTGITHTTLGESAAKDFASEVFGKWASLGREAQNFYRQNLALFAKRTSALWSREIHKDDPTIRNADYVRLTEEEIPDIFKNLSSANVTDLRVNLMKRQEGDDIGKVLFGTNLPDLPEKTNLWYSQQNGLYGVVPNPGKDALRNLYFAIYSLGDITNPLTVGSFQNVESDLTKRPKARFDLNYSKFTTNYLGSKESKVQVPSAQTTGESIFAGYPIMKGIHSIDMVWNKKWVHDAQTGQYYRMENGRKVYYDDNAKDNESTCYANYLGGKDRKEKCPRVMECLYDGKPDTLARCMDVLEDEDMWTVAKDDAMNVGPDMVRVVLGRFGVKGRQSTDSNGDTIKVPMPYDEWMRDVVSGFPDSVRDTIKKNTKLTDYIRGLINTCRANPSILNKTNPQVIAREDVPQFARDLSMNKYMLPEVTKDNVLRLFSGALENATMPRVVNPDLWNVFLSGSMPNVGFFSPYAGQYSNLMGGGFYQQGGHGGVLAITPGLPSRNASDVNIARNSNFARGYKSSNIFTSLFAQLARAMADVGVQIHSDDMDRIREAIAKINQYEQELSLLCDILQSIVKLARFHGISLENIDKDNIRVVKLSKLNDFEDVRDFIRCYVRDITRNMANNMSIQQYTGYELMSKLAPRYCDSCTSCDDDSKKTKCESFTDTKDLVDL